MNIEQFAELILQFLVGIIPTITTGALERIGAGIVETPYNLYKLVRDRFGNNKEAKEALAKLETDPSRREYQETFLEHLVQILRSDDLFASELGAGLINANLGTIAVLGNHNEITQSVGKIASTYIEVNPEHADTINFILNIEGIGPGTLGGALLELNPIYSPLPSVSIPDVEAKDIYSQLRQAISEHTTEIRFDLDSISKILDPVVQIEKGAESPPLPGRFLRNVINEIGQKLDEVKIFSSKFATVESESRINYSTNLDRDDYSSLETSYKLPMPQLARTFERDENKLFIVKTSRSLVKAEVKEEKSRFKLFSKSKGDKSQAEEIVYQLEYDGGQVIHHGEYHIEFYEQRSIWDWEVSERLAGRKSSKDSNNENEGQPPESASLPISADVLAKFLRAAIHDYISYMRYPNIIKSYIESYISES